MNSIYLDILKKQLNNRIEFQEKRPGIMQLFAPFYHEDGDMYDIFFEEVKNGDKNIRISDYGMTIMRLSYSFELDSPNKEKIFQKIITENGINENNGNLYIDAKPESLYPSLLQFVQAISIISNMRLYKREVIKNLFYELLNEFISEKLTNFTPSQKVYPIPQREELEVDYQLNLKKKPVYLFGVLDNTKARLVTISCLEFQKAKIPFNSLIVHENFEDLSKKDRSRITSVVDKQFISLGDFKENANSFLEREAA